MGVRLDLVNLLSGWDFPSELNRARALFIPSLGSYRLVASVVPGRGFGFWLLAFGFWLVLMSTLPQMPLNALKDRAAVGLFL